MVEVTKSKKLLKKDLPSKKVDNAENLIYYFKNYTAHKFMLYENKEKCDGKVVKKNELMDELNIEKIFNGQISQSTLDTAVSQLCSEDIQTKESIELQQRRETWEAIKSALKNWLGDRLFCVDDKKNIYVGDTGNETLETNKLGSNETEILRNQMIDSTNRKISKADFKTLLFSLAKDNVIDIAVVPQETEYIDVITDERITNENYSDFYLLNKHGLPVHSINNYCCFLAHNKEYEGKIRLNLFDKAIYYDGKELNDDGKIKRTIEQEFKSGSSTPTVNRQDYRDAISDVAANNQYHPIKTMLNGLIGKWDGKERLATCFIDLMDADDTRLNRSMTTKWFVAAIKRIMEEPSNDNNMGKVPWFDHILIIYGPQGCGKSKFFTEVFGEQYCNNKISVKMMLTAPQNGLPAWNKCWIGVFDEMTGLDYESNKDFKNFITTNCFTGTMKYKEYASTFYTHQVYCGSTNEKYFLKDDTGERRMWIIDVHSKGHPVDWWNEHFDDYYKEQLLAEAMHIYTNDKNFDINYLDEEDNKALDKVIASHKTMNVHNLETEACEYITQAYVVKSNDRFNNIIDFKEMTTIEGDEKFDLYPNKHKLYIINAKLAQDYIGDFSGKKIPFATMLEKYFNKYGWVLKQWKSKKQHLECYNKMVFVDERYLNGEITDENDEQNMKLELEKSSKSTESNGELPF